MDRPREVEAALKYLADEWVVTYAFVMKYIRNLETKAQCLDEIIAYMKDDTVNWRDISDDFINNILMKYNFK